jgi:hypothetical protein
MAPSFYQMMYWVKSAWREDLSQDCNVNCWRKAGILPERRDKEGGRVQIWGVGEGCSDREETVLSADATHSNVMPHRDEVQMVEGLQVRGERLHTSALPESDELVNADELLELEVENEVCEKESVKEIVTTVTTDHTETVDSDKDEADEWQHPALNAEQTLESARMLK